MIPEGQAMNEQRTGSQWPKGVSGNPGGYSKEKRKGAARVADLAREYTPKAIETLAAIMGDEKAPRTSRIAAANSLLDRAWGRPPQGVEIRTPGDPSFEDDPVNLLDVGRRIAFALGQGLKAKDEIQAVPFLSQPEPVHGDCRATESDS